MKFVIEGKALDSLREDWYSLTSEKIKDDLVNLLFGDLRTEVHSGPVTISVENDNIKRVSI